MKLVIDKDRKVYSAGTWGTKNENNYEILDFEFPEELEEYNKRIVYYLDNTRVWDAILDNKAILTNAITTKGTVKAYVWLTLSETITLKYVCDGTEEGNYYFTYDNTNHYFTMPEVAENDELIYDVSTEKLKLGDTEIATTTTGTGTELTFSTIVDAEEDFRTQLFEMNFYENENADGIVPTPEQIDGFNTMLTAMNEKIAEINVLETNIENAETSRVEAEQGRANAENTRVSNENTRQSNEQTRQTQEASREQRTNQAIAQITDMTEAYNQNAQQKTEAFNQNASNKTNNFDSNAESKTNTFNTNATQKTDAFNSNAESKTSTFNTNATNKTNDFNSNASSKTTAFNNNATSKTNTFNSNAESKTSAFNDNATQKTTNFDNNASSKTNDFNSNATSKTNDFNTNASAKTTAFNENALEKTEDFDEHTEDIQESLDDLAENMVEVTTEQATEITITDAARWNRNKMQIFGNTEQDSTSIAEGDEYDSPTPEHPQNIHVVKGNNTIEITSNSNVFDGQIELGTVDYATGRNANSTTIVRSKNYIPVTTSYNIIAKTPFATEHTLAFRFYDAEYNYIGRDSISVFTEFSSRRTYNNLDNTKQVAYMRFADTSANGDITEKFAITTDESENYVEYQGAMYPFNLGDIELCKIGDVQDYIYKEDGNWYKYNAITKVVLNGTESWSATSSSDGNRFVCNTYTNGLIPINQATIGAIKCDKFSAQSANSTASAKNGIAIAASGKPVIYYDEVKSYTNTQFKEWLSNNNLTTYYAITTPTSIQITDANLIAQLEQIYNHLALTKGTNNITITASDLAPYMKLSYRKPIQPELDDLQGQIDDLSDDVDNEVENLQNQIDNLNQEVSELSENMPWNETEQATEIDITDAAKYSRNKLELFGNTEQAQYSGKNLFNGNYQAATVGGANGRTYNTTTAGRTAVIPCLSNTAYTITKYESSDRYRVYDSSEEPINGASLNVLANQDGADTITITTNADANYLIVYVSTSSEQAEPTMQVEKGSTATDYEPYVGGVPAPNPDYPQSIHVVSGNNTIGVTGKNILRNNRESTTTKGVTFTVNSDGSITAVGTSTSEIDLYITLGGAISLDQSKQYRLSGSPSTASSTTYRLMGKVTKQDNTYGYIADNTGNGVQLPLSAKAILVYINIKNGISINETFYPMVEEGTAKTSYEPYTHTDYSLNLGSLELCKIGNYQDYLYKENGNWYKYGNINKLKLNENGNWSIAATQPTDTSLKAISTNDISDRLFGSGLFGFCSHLPFFLGTSAQATSPCIRYNSGAVQTIIITNNLTVADLKTWLTDNDVYLYYIINTPTLTQITDADLISQLEAIYEHLQLTKGTNNISITASDLAPYMELTYMQDLPSKLDNLDSRLSLLE